jgi:hypothetical protein
MDAMSDEEEEYDLEAGGSQHPLNITQGRQSKASHASKSSAGPIRLGDVWDEREELFDIGDSDDDEEEEEHLPDDNRRSKTGTY